MLLGQDLSHYNPKTDLVDNTAFVWLKATEGRSWTDPELDNWIAHIATVRKDNLPIMGFYHYGRPERGNSAAAEAGHFLETIKAHTGRCLMALDIEGEAFNVEASKLGGWCRDWIETVRAETGIVPFIYCGEPQAKILSGFIPADTPLWIARWYTRVRPGQTEMWQFSSCPFDLDLFYGDRADLVRKATVQYNGCT